MFTVKNHPGPQEKLIKLKPESKRKTCHEGYLVKTEEVHDKDFSRIIMNMAS